MDPEISSLVQSGSASLIALMATDAWQAAREGFARLWRHAQARHAEGVVAELDAGRAEVLAAVAADDRQVLDDLRAEWQGRLRRLLVARPETAAELRRLLEEVAPGPGLDTAVAQHATASGHGRVYQAGRDQHVTER